MQHKRNTTNPALIHLTYLTQHINPYFHPIPVSHPTTHHPHLKLSMAAVVGDTPTACPATHSPSVATITPATMRSFPVIAPIAASLLRASCGASGVAPSSGGVSFKRSKGVTTRLVRAGTEAALNQVKKGEGIVTPAWDGGEGEWWVRVCMGGSGGERWVRVIAITNPAIRQLEQSISQPSTLLTSPASLTHRNDWAHAVRNMAEDATLHCNWHIVRNLPSRCREGWLGIDPAALDTDAIMGLNTAPARAAEDGMAGARAVSAATRA